MSDKLPSFHTDLIRLAGLIKDNWSLCNFLGKTEKEYMVAETIHASVNNLKKHGQAFSIRGNNVFGVHGNGLIDNASSYRALIHDGLFREGTRNIDGKDVTIIWPTTLLIEKLKQYFHIGEYQMTETD